MLQTHPAPFAVPPVSNSMSQRVAIARTLCIFFMTYVHVQPGIAENVYDREAGKNAFFKEVLESQRTFAKLVVPYWNKINGLYYNLGIESPNK